MKTKIDPLTFVLLSIFLSWSWTKLTHDPACQQIIINQGGEYIVPIDCDNVPIS
ncbi:hypothetical protein KCN56_01175 [Photobacterium galatheae]|uniref:hypothetical protein n=1 Tax=Photobacterium galatheae TaxID=1654360 RepID=UPI00202CD14C|nr:hypothetical protein [Photobacterium galatheae]MCM0147179.1 hypothetical protein [Photobacterium galatheae]